MNNPVQLRHKRQQPDSHIEPEAGIKKGHVSSLASLFAQRQASNESLKRVPVPVRRVPSNRSAKPAPRPPTPPPPPPPPSPPSQPPPPKQPAKRAPSPTTPTNLGFTPIGKPARIRIVQTPAADGDDEAGMLQSDSNLANDRQRSSGDTAVHYNSSRDLRPPRFITKKTRYTSRTILERDSPTGSNGDLRPGQQTEQWTVYETLPVTDTIDRRLREDRERRLQQQRQAEEAAAAEEERRRLQREASERRRREEAEEREKRRREEAERRRRAEAEERERRWREEEAERDRKRRAEEDERERRRLLEAEEQDRKRRAEAEERERRLEELRRREVANKTPDIFRREEWTVYDTVPVQQAQPQLQLHQYDSSDSVVGYRRYLDDNRGRQRESERTEDERNYRYREESESRRRSRRETEEAQRRRDEEDKRRRQEEEDRRRRREEDESRRRQEADENRRRREVEESRRRRREAEEEERQRRREEVESRQRQEADENRRRREAEEWRRQEVAGSRSQSKTPEIFSKEEWTVYERIPAYEASTVYETPLTAPASRGRWSPTQRLLADSQDSVVGYRRLLDSTETDGAQTPARRARSFERRVVRSDDRRDRRRSVGGGASEDSRVEEWTVYHSAQPSKRPVSASADKYDPLREFQERKEDEGVETRMSTPFRVEEWTVTRTIPLDEIPQQQRPGLGYQSYQQAVGRNGWNEEFGVDSTAWSRRSSLSTQGRAYPQLGYRNSPGPDNSNVFHEQFSVSRDNPVFRVK